MYSMAETFVAIEAARRGAAVLMKFFRRNYEVRTKQSFNLVSNADFESESAIVEVIRESFPGHAILGEESQVPEFGDSQDLWIIDPLDGTNNFVHGIDQFAISIAYYQHKTAISGVVFRPASDEWFVAESNKGAWRNQERVTVSAAGKLSEAMIGTGFYYDRDRQMRATLKAMEQLFEQGIHGIRRMGAASLDLCMVGCGYLDGYFEFQRSPWDFAAGQLFVTEAGGRVSTCDGKDPGTTSCSVLASNGLLHPLLLYLIEPNWSKVN